ncbi:lipid IV(A) 3-deoxy-D-manno-octulosonic acid transferase [Spongiibacter marinus]|uniref:lipid IV(A) 3-deoxy-D-manno-octulosonic acid transferase n=1 Tax=Spongiibacter marinus TaxID=354246 RepID=UPI0035BE4A2D
MKAINIGLRWPAPPATAMLAAVSLTKLNAMPRLLYSLFFYLILPLVLLRLGYRALRAPDYRRRIGERFGFVSAPEQTGGLWVHAVSVGESIAAAPLIQHMLDRHPELPIVVTCMTPTGSSRIRAMFGQQVHHVYAPYDLPGAVTRFLRRTQPRAAVIMETEIWPNMVQMTARRGIPVVLANARLSARSARGYQRLSGLSRPVIQAFSRIVAQGQDDAERFLSIGAHADQLCVSGSIKFDVAIPDTLRQHARLTREQFGQDRPVWIAASTHDGEDSILLDAHQRVLKQQPDALLVLVPRHPERFDAVAKLVAAKGLPCQRRSTESVISPDTQVLLGDTMGELLLLLGTADIAFIGGSLVPRGGHNSLEAAAWGLPVLAGPSDFNFAQISELLQTAGGLSLLDSAESIAAELIALFADSEMRETRGRNALAVVEANRGALAKLIEEVEGALTR